MSEASPGTIEVERLAIVSGLLPASEILLCRRLRREIAERTGIEYGIGQVILERIFAGRPDVRRVLLEPGGIEELLGADPGIEFRKLTEAAHQEFVEGIQREKLADAAAFQEALRIQAVLAELGILKQVGEILVDLGRVEPPARRSRRDALRTERLPALSFDRIAIYNGFLSEGEAAAARERQIRIEAETGLRIPVGRILYDAGHLRRVEVEAILEAQVKIGRLADEKSEIRILKLSKPEESALVSRLLREGRTTPRDLWLAQETSERLKAHGLSMDPVEVLWFENKIPEEAIRDVLAHQRELLARLDPVRPDVYLTLAPSADALAQERPREISEVEFLFGQAARIAGAVTTEELDRGFDVLRRCRRDFRLGITLGQILCSRHGRDAIRFARLQQTQFEIQELLGYAYEIHSLLLSPLEYEIVSERLEGAGPELAGEIAEATRIVHELDELGIEMDVTEVLLLRGVLADVWIRDLLDGRRDRNRRLIGGWRAPDEPGAPGGAGSGVDSLLFERAFSRSGTATGWGRGLFGALAVDRGLLEPAQIVKALYVQLRARELGIAKPLGEVLVELGHLTAVQVESLLAEQHARLEAIPADRVPEALEIPEDLAGEDRLLYARLVTSVAIDPHQIREALHLRALLRGLGLTGSLREVLVKKGLLDEVVLEGLLREAQRGEDAERRRREEDARARQAAGDFPSADEIKSAYHRAVETAETTTKTGSVRRAVAGRLRAASGVFRPVPAVRPAVLAASVVLALSALAWTWFDDPVPGPGPVEASPAPRPESEPTGADAARFEAAMVARGFVRLEGRWIRADEEPAAGFGGSPGDPIEARRRAFGERTGQKLPEVARDEARRAEEAGRGARGEVSSGGRWVEAARLAEPAEAPALPGAGPISDLEAVLAAESGATRIGVRFRSSFPGGTVYQVALATRERPDAPFHVARFTAAATGPVDVEVAPYGRVLPPGRYSLEVAHRPSGQTRWRPGATLRPERMRVEVALGPEEAVAGRRAERAAVLRRALARLESLAARPAAGAGEGLGETYRALVPPVGEPDLDPFPDAREALLEACRILGELGSTSPAVRSFGPLPDSLAKALDRARSALEE